MADLKKINTKYGNMMVFADDLGLGKALEVYGEYCHAEIKFISDYCNKESFVLDIGSYIGTHTIGIAPNVQHIVSFEASRKSHSVLQQNVSMSGTQNISINNIALGNDVQQVSTDFKYANTVVVPGNDVICTKLDNITGFPRVDFIKIDVSGMEYSVLKGAQNTISYFSPGLMVNINNTVVSKEIFDFLTKLKYNLYWFPVAIFKYKNHKHNFKEIFSDRTGVVNWVASKQKIHALEPVQGRDDTISKIIKRSAI